MPTWWRRPLASLHGVPLRPSAPNAALPLAARRRSYGCNGAQTLAAAPPTARESPKWKSRVRTSPRTRFRRRRRDAISTAARCPRFQWLRSRIGGDLQPERAPGHLRLYGRETIVSLFRQSLFARRQQAHCFSASACDGLRAEHFRRSRASLLLRRNQVPLPPRLARRDRGQSCPSCRRFPTRRRPTPSRQDRYPARPRRAARRGRRGRITSLSRGRTGAWQWLPQQFDASILSDEASAPGLPNSPGFCRHGVPGPRGAARQARPSTGSSTASASSPPPASALLRLDVVLEQSRPVADVSLPLAMTGWAQAGCRCARADRIGRARRILRAGLDQEHRALLGAVVEAAVAKATEPFGTRRPVARSSHGPRRQKVQAEEEPAALPLWRRTRSPRAHHAAVVVLLLGVNRPPPPSSRRSHCGRAYEPASVP